MISWDIRLLNDKQSHNLLVMGIVASISFTVFVAGILFSDISQINANVDTLLTDVGYIRGVISTWDESTYEVIRQVP